MIYYIFLDNGKLNGAGQCPQLTEGVENIEVSEELYNNYIETPDKYIYQDGEIVENPNYEKIKRLKEIDAELLKADEDYAEQLNTPVEYINGHFYKPKWAEETYISLLSAGSLMPSLFPQVIWDSTELEENAVEMTLDELKELTAYLATIQQGYFNARKAKKSALLAEKEQLNVEE